MAFASLFKNCLWHRAKRGIKKKQHGNDDCVQDDIHHNVVDIVKCNLKHSVSYSNTPYQTINVIDKDKTNIIKSRSNIQPFLTQHQTRMNHVRSEPTSFSKLTTSYNPFLDKFIESLNDTVVLLDNKGLIQNYNRRGKKVFYTSIKYNTPIFGYITCSEIESLLASIKEYICWHGVITIVVSKDPRSSIDRLQSTDGAEEDFNQYVIQQVDSSRDPQPLSAKAFLYPIDRNVLLFVIINNKELNILTDNILYGLSKTQLRLLGTIYPRHVIDYFISTNLQCNDISSISMLHMNIGVMFIDIVGWTNIASSLTPHQVFSFLNDLFGRFDNILDTYNVFKLETVGDCYVVVAGLVEPADRVSFKIKENRSNAEIIKEMFALYCCAQEAIETASMIKFPDIHQTVVKLRIGLHIGSVFSGIVGHQMPKFCLYGDTMNIASRMESTAPVDHIQMSSAFYQIIANKLKETGYPQQVRQVDIKGKGIMQTHLCGRHSNTGDNGNAVRGFKSVSADSRELPFAHKSDLSAIVSLASYVQKRKINVSFDIVKDSKVHERNAYANASDDSIGIQLHSSIKNFLI